MVCDGYVKYGDAEIDRLVAILKTNNCGGGGGGPCTVSSPPRQGLLNNIKPLKNAKNSRRIHVIINKHKMLDSCKNV